MTTIDIEEFEGYDVDEFIEFLSTEKDGEFELILPKETTLSFCPNEEISQEFAIAAYVGQKLHEISTKFSYFGAQVVNPGEFSYEFRTARIDELAELIAEISSVFGNAETIEPINFPSEVAGFMEDFKGKKVVCQDLFDTAYEYYSEDEEEEDED